MPYRRIAKKKLQRRERVSRNVCRQGKRDPTGDIRPRRRDHGAPASSKRNREGL
jgi:hypothetical protein